MNTINGTARVDFQKLAILNDRICQCLEAIQQVRMSAHSWAPYNTGLNTPFQSNQGFAPNYSAQGFVPSYGATYPTQFPQSYGFASGLTNGMNLGVQNGWNNGLSGVSYGSQFVPPQYGYQSNMMNPVGAHQYGAFGSSGYPQFVNPFAWPSHSTFANMDMTRTATPAQNLAPAYGW